jgi:NAD(P)-dependent dehydrogenase (short-subunit alcohol dehydrogenase family)
MAPITLSSAGSYLIVGGTGGLGLSIIRWMAQRGAKSLILVSRSVESSDGAKLLADELQKIGCTLHLRNCDAADKDMLASTLQACRDSLPPIKGVIHAAMLLLVSNNHFPCPVKSLHNC